MQYILAEDTRSFMTQTVVELVFKGLIKARIRHDFTLYLSMKKVEHFEDIWSVENLLFWVDVLSF